MQLCLVYLGSQVKGDALYLLLVHLVPDGSFGCAWMCSQCINVLALQGASKQLASTVTTPHGFIKPAFSLQSHHSLTKAVEKTESRKYRRQDGAESLQGGSFTQ